MDDQKSKSLGRKKSGTRLKEKLSEGSKEGENGLFLFPAHSSSSPSLQIPSGSSPSLSSTFLPIKKKKEKGHSRSHSLAIPHSTSNSSSASSSNGSSPSTSLNRSPPTNPIATPSSTIKKMKKGSKDNVFSSSPLKYKNDHLDPKELETQRELLSTIKSLQTDNMEDHSLKSGSLSTGNVGSNGGVTGKKSYLDELSDSDVEFQIVFFENNGNVCVLKDDENKLSEHWENVLRKAGGVKTNVIPKRAKMSLTGLISRYFSDGGESKVTMLKWLGRKHLTGSKQAYLAYLSDHYAFQLRILPRKRGDQVLQGGNLSSSAPVKSHRRSRSSDFSMSPIMSSSPPPSRMISSSSHIVQSSKIDRRTPYNSKKTLTITYSDLTSYKQHAAKEAAFEKEREEANRIVNSPLSAVNASSIIGSDGNGQPAKSGTSNGTSHSLSSSASMPSIQVSKSAASSIQEISLESSSSANGLLSILESGSASSGGSSYQRESLSDSLDGEEQPKPLFVIFDTLVEQERFEEAIQCKALMEAQLDVDKKQIEYENAKNEDRLHDAIAIRQEIKALSEKLAQFDSDGIGNWISAPPAAHMTLQQIQELLVDAVGTKRALPFIEEFSGMDMKTIASTDLKQALEIQNRCKKRLEEFGFDELLAEEQRRKKQKEEEERWLKEAAEKRKRKMEKKNQLGQFVKSKSEASPKLL